MASNSDCNENILTFKILNNDIIYRFSLPYASIETLFEKFNIELKERNLSTENVKYVDDAEDLICLKSFSDLAEAVRSKPSVLCVVVSSDSARHSHDYFHGHVAPDRSKCRFKNVNVHSQESSSESSSGEEVEDASPHHRKHRKFMKMMECMRNEHHKHKAHKKSHAHPHAHPHPHWHPHPHPHPHPHFGRRHMLPGDGEMAHFGRMSHHFNHGKTHRGGIGKFRGGHRHPFGHHHEFAAAAAARCRQAKGCSRLSRFHNFDSNDEMIHPRHHQGRKHHHFHF